MGSVAVPFTNAPSCVACALPVLELRGQFTVLAPYLVDRTFAAHDTAGTWHLSCLDGSGAGRPWYQPRLANLHMRGYEPVAEAGDWSVVLLRRTGERLAVCRNGSVLSLSALRAGARREVDGGVCCTAVDAWYGIELHDVERVAAIQATLTTTGAYPVLSLAEILGMRHKLSHPEFLDRAALLIDTELRAEWTPRFVLARAECDVFVSTDLVPHLDAAAD